MLDSLVDLVTAGPVAYLVVLGLVSADAIVPVFPSETALITGGILAARDELALGLLVPAGALGAVVGDTVLYLAGGRAATPLERRLFKGERARRRLERVRSGLDDRPWLLLVADFIPGARTAAMFAAGATGLGRARFYAFVVPGAVLWAAVHATLGHVGGTLFRESMVAPLAASLGVAALVAAAFELVDRRTDLV